jgi:hypothetical protein
MKKIITLILCIVLALSVTFMFASCSIIDKIKADFDLTKLARSK